MNAVPNTVKPPVPWTDAAIKAGIAHEAANGPSYVRIKALGMMARITGLFEQGKQLGKQLARDAAQTVDQTTDQASQKLSGVAARVAGLMNGTLQPTPEELAHFEPDNPVDDEDHPKESDDDPP
ncbi:MAG: hypothetical protein OXT70_08395 [Chloroflexota bacterium]|nr:hypothetical protein [Chloroflexota bacterium]